MKRRYRIRLLHIIIIFLCAGTILPLVVKKIRTSSPCPKGMATIYGGTYEHGTEPDTLKYIISKCNDEVKNCYNEWFSGEQLRTVRIKTTFCIDQFEYPNNPGEEPTSGVTWETAQRICSSLGKRLCRESEWEQACNGKPKQTWSFGDTFKKDACNINGDGVEPSYDDKRHECKSAYGVYDMNGNLAEWTISPVNEKAKFDDKDEPRYMKGGSYKDHPLFTRCAFRDSFKPGISYEHFGFRCCMNSIQ